ncbi:MAG: inorganic diphosphatase, partial [Candidatus Omnitrophica bacterium]|nr:inorganic diphosphatase [Candidatus Omnitrophota bacterium]
MPTKVKRVLVITLAIISCACLSSVKAAQDNQCAPNSNDPNVLDCAKNFLTDYETLNSDGSVNIIIEISAGTLEKWEVMPDGVLKRDIKDAKPRSIKYLGYPGNYGMIPKTLGGDNDPLDAIIIGAPPLARGSVASAKIIGVFKLVDDGETDDKLIAVLPETDLYKVDSIKELDKKFPGITKILKTWFTNYKGRGEITSKGYGS